MSIIVHAVSADDWGAQETSVVDHWWRWSSYYSWYMFVSTISQLCVLTDVLSQKSHTSRNRLDVGY